VALVARAGDPAPGLPAGATYAPFTPNNAPVDPVINDSGELAFTVSVNGDPNTTSAVFAGKQGAIKPIALSGQNYPGLPPSDTILGFYDLQLNNAGQMAFLANVTTNNSNYPNQLVALMTYDPTAGVSVAAIDGTVLPGVGQAPIFVYMLGDNGGYHSPILNDSGQLVFSGLFGDGYRLLELNVPEPSLTGVAGVAIFCGLLRRRR
jgi:hypothetical protein